MSVKANHTLDNAKEKVLNKGCSVNKLKCQIRQEYRDRIKRVRYEQTNKNREMWMEIMSNITTNVFVELKKHLLQSRETATLDCNEIVKILNEVEDEMYYEALQRQAEQYELESQLETNAIVDNLFPLCSVCAKPVEGKYNVSSQVCTECTSVCFQNDTNVVCNNNMYTN